jgi:hypothetical protein
VLAQSRSCVLYKLPSGLHCCMVTY